MQKQIKRKVASSEDCSAKGSKVEESLAAPSRLSRDSKIYAARQEQDMQRLPETHGHIHKLFVDSFRCVLETLPKFEPLAPIYTERCIKSTRSSKN